MRVGDAHHAVADAQDPPRSVAELEDVARQRLDGEVFVERADEMALGLEQHAVVEHFRNRAAVGDRADARAFSTSYFFIQTIMMQERPAAAAPRRVAAREHVHHFVEFLFLQVPVRICDLEQLEKRRLVPLLLGRGLGDDLLREDIERLVGHRHLVELAIAHRPHHSRALDEVVARQREDPALGRAVDAVPGPPYPLQQGRNAVRRGDLADKVDMTDVDAELERRRRHQHSQLPVPQPFFGIQPRFLGEAAVVGGDDVIAQPLRQLMRHPLREPASVDRDQRGPMRLDQCHEAVIDLLPHFARHDRFQRRARDLDPQVDLSLVSFIDDRAWLFIDQIFLDCLDGLLRRRQADPLQLPAADVIEALERQREVGAAPRLQDRVDLVDDHHPGSLQHRPRALGGEQQVQGLGRGDEDVRRGAQHRRPLVLGRVPAANRGRDFYRVKLENLPSRHGEILVDIGRQGLEGRHIDDAHFIGQATLFDAFLE